MKSKIQLTLIIVAASIASLGTYPYAKDFSYSLVNNSIISFLLSIICVPAAICANIALGTYSLNNSIIHTKNTHPLRTVILTIICLLSAASTGFMCFIGYNARLSNLLNIVVSTSVFIVNAAIGFSAINSAINDFQKIKDKMNKDSLLYKVKRNFLKLILSITTVIAALLVTLTAYLATTHGMLNITKHFDLSGERIERIIYSIAILIWFPGAVLFANGSRNTVGKIYDKVQEQEFNLSSLTLIAGFIAFWSGSAYAQMALEFFNDCKNIPPLFKYISSHYNIVFYLIMPMAFLISGAVNGYALNHLIKTIRKNKRYTFNRKNSDLIA